MPDRLGYQYDPFTAPDRDEDGVPDEPQRIQCAICRGEIDIELSKSVGWTACAPCVWGEADSLDSADFIPVVDAPQPKRKNAR